MHAPVDMLTKLKVLRHAMLSLLDRTVGTVKYVSAKQVIIALVKLAMKLRVHPDTTPPTKDPLHALHAHPECMPTLLVPQLAKIATVTHTNPKPMLQNVFQ